MNTKIKKIIFIMILTIFLPIYNTNAEEVYYTNKYNVRLTKEEYEFLSKFYWEGYQDDMTLNDYQEFVESNIMNGEFETVEINHLENEGLILYSTSHETNSKTMKISKSCNSKCSISVVVTWKNVPNTKSYDVIGAYLDGVNLLSKVSTNAKASGITNSIFEIKKDNNGFGASISLPTSGSSYVISQTYTVSKGGTVYASYQHAKSSISLANSKNYTISREGYGGVFKFSGIATNIYDAMGGVSITV